MEQRLLMWWLEVGAAAGQRPPSWLLEMRAAESSASVSGGCNGRAAVEQQPPHRLVDSRAALSWAGTKVPELAGSWSCRLLCVLWGIVGH